MGPMLKALRGILHTPTNSTHLIIEKKRKEENKVFYAIITTCMRAYLFIKKFIFLDQNIICFKNQIEEEQVPELS